MPSRREIFVLAAALPFALAVSPARAAGLPLLGLRSDGRPAGESDFPGWRLVYFGYTHCPDVCPLGLQTMAEALDALGPLGEKVSPVFVTVDPDRDTPAKLDEFVGSFDPRFIGLSGNREETDRIIKAFRVYARKVDGAGGDYTMDHTAAVYLLDRDARFVGVINFQEETAKALAKIRPLLAAK